MPHLPLWKFIASRLKAEQTVMLLVVVESSGSSPGRPGFKMAVDEAGGLCGSIGGGIMEIKLVELAKDRLRAAQTTPLIKRQIHRKTAPHDQSGMICSGEQTVVFTLLKQEDIETVRTIIRCLKNDRSAVLRLMAQDLQVVKDRKNDRPFSFYSAGENAFLFEENLGYHHRLFIIGGGHCALALCELMAGMDFYIRLYDDRPELSTMVKNRFAHAKHIIESYDRIGDLIPSGNDVYVVVMTVGYRTDEQVIRRLIGKEMRYFGVLGSAAKMAALLDRLRREGFPADLLDRIHTPVGLPINSRTPAEIAVSIAAQIIAVKNA